MPKKPRNTGNRPLDEDTNPRIGLSSCNHCKEILGPTQKYGYCRHCKMPIHMTMACINCNRTGLGETDTEERTEPAEDEREQQADSPPSKKKPEFRFELDEIQEELKE